MRIVERKSRSLTRRHERRIMDISRRLFLGATACATLVGAAPSHPSGSALSADAAVAELLAGNRRYASGKTIHGNLTARRDEVAPSQHPFAMVLSCSDSRVPPELVFDQSLGDLFVARLAGNYAETGGIGSFEYAYEHFHPSVLLVLGHSGCGAVSATVDALKTPHASIPGDIAAIVAAITPAAQEVQHASGDPVANAIAQNARNNAVALRTRSDILRAGVEAGKLRIAAGVYDLHTGIVHMLD